jgi:4-alpha-glucanotransferase
LKKKVMRFPPLDRHFTGISVPVAALRTDASCGVGEFADLTALGKWCRNAGLDLIQLLPVNDTGGNSSPYSALSAFALHPLYLRLNTVPGAGRYAKEIDAFRAEAGRGGARARFSYREVRAFKLSLIGRVFADTVPAVRADPAFARWREENPWVVPYAVFTALRARCGEKPWAEWPELREPDAPRIREWWDAHPLECLPVAWTQFLLEGQLTEAARSLSGMGVSLKGDLPILMCTDSADVWEQRRFFDLSGCAGAPPDMFSPDGQNWGFPVYDWEALGRDGYRWWKERLRQAGKFFNAFRIDHVLGFFRIWRIPHGEVTSLLGRFSPSSCLTLQDLQGLGFDQAAVRWLSLPHVSGAECSAALGPDAARVQERYLVRIGAEELYNLSPEIDGEMAIRALDEPKAVKDFLSSRHADRTLLDQGNGEYCPAWYIERGKGFRSLPDQRKSALMDLLARRRAESEAEWAQRGRDLLAVMRASTDMLVCAEDLGDVPRCVPVVLAELGILGLKIVRWAREYDAPGQPFLPFARYPLLSVCTPSVHDTSTLRGWWEEDPAERELFHAALGESGPCPRRMTPELLRKVMAQCFSASSILCMFQLQDILDLDEGLWADDPKSDRINVPGTVNDWNWTWRMPLAIEELSRRPLLMERLGGLVKARRGSPVRGTSS